MSMSNNSTNDTWEVNPAELADETGLYRGLKTFAYSSILVLSLLGNTFLIVAIKRNINGRMRTVSNLLIASVAVSDLCMTVWSVPERITRILTHDSWLVPGAIGSVLCKIVNFTEKLSITVSILHLGTLSIERFLVVYSPYKTVITTKVVKYIIGIIWVGSAVYWSPILYFGGLRERNDAVECKVRSFTPHWREWYLVFIILLCITMVVIPLVYSAIVVKLCIRKMPGMQVVTQRRTSEHMKRRVAVLVGVIVMAFYMCFLPYWIGWVSCSYLRQIPSAVCNETYRFFSILFSYASTTANPIICVIFVGYFRFALKAALLDPLNRHKNDLQIRRRRASVTEETASAPPGSFRMRSQTGVGTARNMRMKDLSSDSDIMLADRYALTANAAIMTETSGNSVAQNQEGDLLNNSTTLVTKESNISNESADENSLVPELD